MTCLVTLSTISLLKIPNLLDSIFYQKFVIACMMYQVVQLFQTPAFTLGIYLHFWTPICSHLVRGLNLISRTLIIFYYYYYYYFFISLRLKTYIKLHLFILCKITIIKSYSHGTNRIYTYRSPGNTGKNNIKQKM